MKLEKEIEELKEKNEEVAKQRKNYGPEEQRLAGEIERQLTGMREKEEVRKEDLRKISAASLFKNLERVYMRVMALGSLSLRNNFTEAVIFRKKLFGALKISQNYLSNIKSKTLGKFKSLLTPWAEQHRLRTLLESCRNLRTKASNFAKWRK